MKVKSESEVAQSRLTLRNPMTAAYQAPPSMGFSQQEYWSGVPLPSPIASLYLPLNFWISLLVLLSTVSHYLYIVCFPY